MQTELLYLLSFLPPRNEKALGVQGLLMMAEWTGLEPATPGVTGRYSNRLNYHSRYCNSSLMPDWLVGAERLELPTYAL